MIDLSLPRLTVRILQVHLIFWQQDVSIIDHLQSYEQTEVEGLRLIFPNSKR